MEFGGGHTTHCDRHQNTWGLLPPNWHVYRAIALHITGITPDKHTCFQHALGDSEEPDPCRNCAVSDISCLVFVSLGYICETPRQNILLQTPGRGMPVKLADLYKFLLRPDSCTTGEFTANYTEADLNNALLDCLDSLLSLNHDEMHEATRAFCRSTKLRLAREHTQFLDFLFDMRADTDFPYNWADELPQALANTDIFSDTLVATMKEQGILDKDGYIVSVRQVCVCEYMTILHEICREVFVFVEKQSLSDTSLMFSVQESVVYKLYHRPLAVRPSAFTDNYHHMDIGSTLRNFLNEVLAVAPHDAVFQDLYRQFSHIYSAFYQYQNEAERDNDVRKQSIANVATQRPSQRARRAKGYKKDLLAIVKCAVQHMLLQVAQDRATYIPATNTAVIESRRTQRTNHMLANQRRRG